MDRNWNPDTNSEANSEANCSQSTTIEMNYPTGGLNYTGSRVCSVGKFGLETIQMSSIISSLVLVTLPLLLSLLEYLLESL